MEFSEQEAKIIQPYFTNMDKPVFALRNLPEVVKGAMFSRYSRTDKSLRRVLLDEFINISESGFGEIVSLEPLEAEKQIIATKKAEEFYDRVLVGFGDDSVAELGGCHLACENVSNIATKILEDARIGLSPLEKSTRYVFFNEKVNGEFKYYKDPVLMKSEFADLYAKTMNQLFETYTELIEPMKKYVIETNPREENTSDRAYNFTIRAKACDVLRSLLPASTLTNVGIYGNGRAFEYLLTKMFSHQLTEIRELAFSMQEELKKVIPSFVKRSNDDYGKQQQAFLSETQKSLEQLSSNLLKIMHSSEGVRLVDFDENAETKIISAIIYAHSKFPYFQILEKVKNMKSEEKKIILNEYVNRRQNRRNKPGRAFEHAYYTFDLLGNFGMYRDLQRHRLLTQFKQDLTVENGYDTPKELIEAGFEEKYVECMQKAKQAFNEISKSFPKEAQYVVPLGYRIRWLAKFNLREAFHLIELRTTRQGHPDYRKMCQEIFLKIKEVHPGLVESMKFVDMNSYSLERLEAEKKLDKKMGQMKEKQKNIN